MSPSPLPHAHIPISETKCHVQSEIITDVVSDSPMFNVRVTNISELSTGQYCGEMSFVLFTRARTEGSQDSSSVRKHDPSILSQKLGVDQFGERSNYDDMGNLQPSQ